MMTDFPDQITTAHDELFSALRAKLACEVSGSAMLADLLEKVNGMQAVQTCPAEFKSKFDEFVGRAEEYSTAIRPFFPELLGFTAFPPKARGSFQIMAR